MHLSVPSGRTVSAAAIGVEGGLERDACSPRAGRGAINDLPPLQPPAPNLDVTKETIENRPRATPTRKSPVIHVRSRKSAIILD